MKQNKNKTWLRMSVALLLALVTLLIAACNGNQGGGGTPIVTDPPVAEGETNPLETIETRDFGGRKFTFLSPGYCNSWAVGEDVSYEEDIAGDPIMEVQYKRTLAFEEKYNCEVAVAGGEPVEVFNDMRTVKELNSTDFDLVYPHPTHAVASMMTAGYLKDILSVDTVNTTNEWYNQRQVENYVTNGKLYLATSDITITGQAFFAIVYNREVLAKYQIETDIKTLVETGNWTIDTMNDILTLTEFSGDNADGSQTYGLMFNAMADGRWIWALGGSILDKNEDGEFVAGCTGKNMLPIANGLHSLIHTHGKTVHIEEFGNSGIPTSQLMASFKAGKALFITYDVGSCFSNLREVDFAKGYAPLPKLDDKQDDYYVNCASGLMGIPCSVVDFEESGLGFDYFARYSNVYLKPAFFEIVLGGRLSEYPEDYEMLNFLHSKKTFDVGYTLDEDMTFLRCMLTPVIKNKNPDGISIYLAAKGKDMKALLAIANGIE